MRATLVSAVGFAAEWYSGAELYGIGGWIVGADRSLLGTLESAASVRLPGVQYRGRCRPASGPSTPADVDALIITYKINDFRKGKFSAKIFGC